MAKKSENEKNLPAKQGAPIGSHNALKHGAYSVTKGGLRHRSRAVSRLTNRVFIECPWLTEADKSTVRSWCELEHLGATLFSFIKDKGVVSVSGDTKRVLKDYTRIKTLQLQYAKELGLSPSARAQLRVDSLEGDALSKRLEVLRANGEALEDEE